MSRHGPLVVRGTERAKPLQRLFFYSSGTINSGKQVRGIELRVNVRECT